METRVIRMRRVGMELFGDDWKSPLADRVGVTRRTLRLWDQAVHPIPADLDERLLSVVVAEQEVRKAELARLDDLRDALATIVRSRG
jgi:hypothetical protein